MKAGRTVLCTSENLYELYALVCVLKEVGYKVTMAASPDRAIKFVKETRFDAIVVSAANASPHFAIPGLLKSFSPHTPILLLTLRKLEPGCFPDGVDATAPARPDVVPAALGRLFSV